MSRIHKALSRPQPPAADAGSDFNPLNRSAGRRNRPWWWITALASLATVALLTYREWPMSESAAPADEVPTTVARTPAAPVARSGTSERQAAAASAARPSAAPARPEQPPTTETEAEVSPAEATPAPEATPTPVETKPADPASSTPADPASAPAPAPVATTSAEPKKPRPVAEPPRDSEPGVETAKTQAEHSPEPTPNAPAEPAPDASDAGSVTLAENRSAALERQVQTALDRGELERAEALLRDWIDRAPEVELPRLWLAKIYLSNRMPEAAQPLLTGLDSIEALGLRGLALEKTGRYSEAAKVFEHLSRREPETPQWWLRWAINQENSGRLAQARILYQTFLREFPAHDASLTDFARERYRALEGG